MLLVFKGSDEAIMSSDGRLLQIKRVLILPCRRFEVHRSSQSAQLGVHSKTVGQSEEHVTLGLANPVIDHLTS